MTRRVSNTRVWQGAELTVSVDVHGARVPLAVVVRVDLCGVVHIRAVVTAVPNLILVVVKLAGVKEKLAVVLREGEGRSQETAWELCWVARHTLPGSGRPTQTELGSPRAMHLPPAKTVEIFLWQR